MTALSKLFFRPAGQGVEPIGGGATKLSPSRGTHRDVGSNLGPITWQRRPLRRIPMNTQLLIDAIVRQTTVLIAQLATSGGVRAPLAHVASQVFVELAKELESQGLSRKVTADMFGISLRSYQRKMQRLKESSTERGQSLWEAILKHVKDNPMVTRRQVLDRFHRDEEALVRGILHDLVESGLVFSSGASRDAVFRAATGDELGSMQKAHGREGVDKLVWAVVFHEGPIRHDQLAERLDLARDELDPILERLLAETRIQAEQRADGTTYCAASLVVKRNAQKGWEASVYDHFRAFVQTICCRLNPDPETERFEGLMGGCTYSFRVGPDHPLEGEVLNTLSQFRDRCSELRQRVIAYNREHGPPHPSEKVIVYAGECVIPRDIRPETGAGDSSEPEEKSAEEV